MLLLLAVVLLDEPLVIQRYLVILVCSILFGPILKVRFIAIHPGLHFSGILSLSVISELIVLVILLSSRLCSANDRERALHVTCVSCLTSKVLSLEKWGCCILPFLKFVKPLLLWLSLLPVSV